MKTLLITLCIYMLSALIMLLVMAYLLPGTHPGVYWGILALLLLCSINTTPKGSTTYAPEGASTTTTTHRAFIGANPSPRRTTTMLEEPNTVDKVLDLLLFVIIAVILIGMAIFIV